MTSNSCFFCKIKPDNPDLFWHNKYFKALFDAYPVTPGHFLIIPQRHVVDFEDLNKNEWENLKTTLETAKKTAEEINLKQIYQQLIEKKISKKSVDFCQAALQLLENSNRPEAYNYGINDGRLAGRTIDHLHLHVIPRYRGDSDNPVGGVRGIIPQKQNYH